MKYIIPLFILSLSLLQADYLNTRDRNHCIINLEPRQNSSGYCYHDQNQDRDECDRRLSMDDLVKGYVFNDDGDCVLKNDLKVSGMTQNQWNWAMATLAHVTGFSMLFLVTWLSALVVRK